MEKRNSILEQNIMKNEKNYKAYFISSLIIFILALALTIFQSMLVSDQVKLATTIGNEKKAKFENELWAFRTADKLFGWGVIVPRKSRYDAYAVMQKVRYDTNRNAYIINGIYIVSAILLIIGIFKERRKLNKGVPATIKKS